MVSKTVLGIAVAVVLLSAIGITFAADGEPDATAPEISVEEAEEIATDRVGGSVQEVAEDREEGPVFEVIVETEDGSRMEVAVDGEDGDVIEVTQADGEDDWQIDDLRSAMAERVPDIGV
jgi:hypothetical protein